MVRIGEYNKLNVTGLSPAGALLDAGEGVQILLPEAQIPKGLRVDETVQVFVYHNKQDQLQATTFKPYAQVHQCANLKVVSVNRVGAFLDWGLDKNILLPFGEQERPVDVGQRVIVYLYLDKHTQRIVASTKLKGFLHEQGFYLKPQQQVEIMIWSRTDLGYKAIIEDRYIGLLFKDEAFSDIRPGQRMTAYIKQIREEDQKIDLTLQLHNQQSRDQLQQDILDDLAENGGVSYLTDKSPAEAINERFRVSKGAYKKAIGALYKQKLISLSKEKISLINP